MHVIHPIPPVWDRDSRILILGSFPSVKSREQGFFYGHPQNRFWKVLAQIFQSPCPVSVDEKKDFLHSHHIAVWDVVSSCDIQGSSDSSMKSVEVNDLSTIIQNASIVHIFLNGKTAQKYYIKYTQPMVKVEASVLPSTSPANATWTLEKLVEAWKVVRIADSFKS